MAQALHGRVGIMTRTEREYLEVVQGEEKSILFIVDGLFDSAIFDLITAKFGDVKRNVVAKVEEPDNSESFITRLLEEEDIQVFRCRLTPTDTADLAAGIVRIELSFDNQKAILPNSLKMLEAVES